jgi:hypothetical protein
MAKLNVKMAPMRVKTSVASKATRHILLNNAVADPTSICVLMESASPRVSVVMVETSVVTV